MHAIVLAGEKEGSIPVLGRNKALLPVRGRTLVSWVTQALEGAANVDSITVVGPVKDLGPALADIPLNKPVRLIEQGANVFENIWKGAEAANGGPEFADDFTVLCLTCDVPMLKAAEVDAFIATAPMDRADIAFGVTRHELLKPFEPAGGRPGIKFIYMRLRDMAIRHGNLFCLRPARLAEQMRDYIPLIYRLRYQRRLGKVLEAAGALTRFELSAGAFYVFWALQAGSWCYNHGHPGLSRFCSRRLELGWAEGIASRTIRTRFAINETIGPGATLDVDNENSYRAFEEMMPEWEERQAEIIGGAK